MQSLQQHINKIAELFFRLGGETAVICPGSRNAPVIVAFVRHKKIKCIPVSDERSAGFIALGIAQQTRKPVAVICTSGTATLNFYPAICEAFYQSIPLVVLTADRPPELIDQWDGQAIRQNEIYKNHILEQITLPATLNKSSMQAIESEVTETIRLCIQQKLPVHINIPFSEPFYPASTEKYIYNEQKINPAYASLLPIHISKKDVFEMESVITQIQEYKNDPDTLKLLLVIGFNDYDEKMMHAIDACRQKIGFPVISDVISNYRFEDAILNYDLILDEKKNKIQLSPDILITIGAAVLSKNLRKYLRNHKPGKHFHIQSIGPIGDPFQSLTNAVRVEPELFFDELSKQEIDAAAYFNLWKREDQKVMIDKEIQNLPFCELKAAKTILKSLPQNSNLQLSNSMPVRYAMLFGLNESIKINCNRGTNGIDGCSSTAVGAAISSTKLTTLLTGDIAFFYDVNAFWNNLALPHLRVIILNNGGGGIFRLIEGPSELDELEEFIENAHSRTAEHIAKDFKMEYTTARNEKELNKALKILFDESKGAKILEVFTDKFINEKEYKGFKESVLV